MTLSINIDADWPNVSHEHQGPSYSISMLNGWSITS